MGHLIYHYIAVVLIAAALAGIAVWAPRALSVKVSALVIAALLMPTAYASLVDLLGKPKPVAMEWAKRAVPDATVLGTNMHEGQAIYLWLQFDDAREPRAYVLPWSLETARQLNRAARAAETEGTALRMRRPFESDPDPNEPLFYAAPRPGLPPKTPLTG